MTNAFAFLEKPPANGLPQVVELPWDEVLFESEHFAVVPTIGALVEGWLLLVTKRPYLCMGALEDELLKELNEVKDRVVAVLRAQYGDVAAFEHGPAKRGRAIGCGVDHAHLHILPVRIPLIERVPTVTESTLKWEPVADATSIGDFYRGNIPYLYVEQPIGNAHIAAAWDVPSQLFRRVIAAAIGSPEAFDWRTNPMETHVASTINALRGRFTDKAHPHDNGIATAR